MMKPIRAPPNDPLDSESHGNAIGQLPRLHHVGIVVPDEKKAMELMELMGLKESHRGEVERYQALCIFTQGNGGSPIEWVVPKGGKLKDFNRGIGGIHHIAVTVGDLAKKGRELAEQGIQLIEKQPSRGGGDFTCNFLHPAYTGGTIIEFIEEDPNRVS